MGSAALPRALARIIHRQKWRRGAVLGNDEVFDATSTGEAPRMPESTRGTVRFGTGIGVPLEAAFDAGRLTSDGGLPWLAEADAALGVCEALAAEVPEWRRGAVRHPLATLVRQRVYQIACGYEDQDDADTLRADPLLKLACGRLPEGGADLASQPTLSRLENAADRGACYRLARALVGVYLRERERDGVPTHIRLHMYHPLLIFDGDTDHLIAAVLRPGNAHGSRGVVAILRRLVAALRARWPGVRIELRADSGFAVPALYDYCEAERITYTIGLAPNARLVALAAPLLAEAERQHAETGAKVRLAGEASYQAGTWPRPRRVVFKAEVLEKGPNTRFVVTTRPGDPLAIYDRYVDRGEVEQWIGDLKLACFADRLRCHRFWAN